MGTYKGILNFPNVHTAKTPQGANEPKFGCGLLMPANDPQVPVIQALVQEAKSNTFPTGFGERDVCFDLYEKKIPPSKDYHDPRFVGWYLLTSSAKADDRPVVIDSNHQPIIDPAAVYGGLMAWMSLGISGYVKGKGGIGGWLNGVKILDDEPPMGRLDNKPSVEQMFANTDGAGQTSAVATGELIMTAAANGKTYAQYKTANWTDKQMINEGVATAPPVADTPAPPVADTPAPPVADTPAPPTPPVQLIMTAAAKGMTYEAYVTAGWSDQQMIDSGVAQKPSFS